MNEHSTPEEKLNDTEPSAQEPQETTAENLADATAESAATTPTPEQEILKLQLELADWKDKYVRAIADFDNFRKKANRERVELIASASSEVIKALLPVLDDFDRAMKANESTDDAAVLKEGFGLIHQKFFKILESKGLQPMGAMGQDFNTDFHEAITQISAPDQAGKVVDELEKGYMHHDKVLRYAKVVIGQ
ncbi:MAG: nucleotide exchange factor GrpE [Flavobacteriales bacterium]